MFSLENEHLCNACGVNKVKTKPRKTNEFFNDAIPYFYIFLCFPLCISCSLSKLIMFPCRPEEYDYDPDSTTLGFQVDRVKNGGDGEGKVRLTAYHRRSGKVNWSICSSTSAIFMTWYFFRSSNQRRARSRAARQQCEATSSTTTTCSVSRKPRSTTSTSARELWRHQVTSCFRHC